MAFEAKNYMIKDAELNWAKLVSPASPFGSPQFELQVATTDKAKADEMTANNLKVKEIDGKFVVSLKRKAVKADGSDNGAPRVVGLDKSPIDGSKIGNGSKGNVIVFQYEYNAAGRTGIASSLTAVQVTDMVEYTGTGGVDFDDLSVSDDAGKSEAAPF